MSDDKKKIAVVLFQLGGPDNLAAVEPFLYNLFCDPDIINFPGSFLARKPLAKLIALSRSKRKRQDYAAIGGGSPIRRLTEQQARSLELALQRHLPARAIVAMRYWHPDTQAAIAALEGEPYDELVLLPLYPHYSFATTGSSLKEWNRHNKPKVQCISSIISSIIRTTSRESWNASREFCASSPSPSKSTSCSAHTGCR